MAQTVNMITKAIITLYANLAKNFDKLVSGHGIFQSKATKEVGAGCYQPRGIDFANKKHCETIEKL